MLAQIAHLLCFDKGEARWKDGTIPIFPDCLTIICISSDEGERKTPIIASAGVCPDTAEVEKLYDRFAGVCSSELQLASYYSLIFTRQSFPKNEMP